MKFDIKLEDIDPDLEDCRIKLEDIDDPDLEDAGITLEDIDPD